MEVTIVNDHRFHMDAQGRIWTSTNHDYSFWQRYLVAFGKVNVTARCDQVGQPQPGWLRADGPGVSFTPLVKYIGPQQFLQKLPALFIQVLGNVRRSRMLVFRSTSILLFAYYAALQLSPRPYAMELIGDPDDLFQRGQVGGRLGKVFGPALVWVMRQLAWNSRGNLYVTRHFLQQKYPHRFKREFGISDVMLDTGAFSEHRSFHQGTLSCIMVGNLAQPYKGVDVAIHAVHKVSRHRPIRLTIIGDGQLRAGYEQLARDLGIAEQVHFLGSVPSGQGVRHHMQQADLFLMTSRAEGLPRAMLEAMAVGLPVISTAVGGIPELIDDRYLTDMDDADQLAAQLLLVTPEELQAMSQQNYKKALEYGDALLDRQRLTYFTFLRTEAQAAG
ncbi:glycosyltransferase [Deinococcus radiophilus]|uniref:Glycosyltransferase n=1 Tax=Deinococcus radiophilus TaxID=32062 RepID=A0A3S0KB98_9DEIO|nr:glycosyltransferase [Deinococcus radiophilus]RTR26854.1 glycosyltransferase [Deinococcus radiophilus]UFA51780.1 glycosyltransferase [Deinococcus radiophilus]